MEVAANNTILDLIAYGYYIEQGNEQSNINLNMGAVLL